MVYAYEPEPDSLLNAEDYVYPMGQAHLSPGLDGFRDLWYMPANKQWLLNLLDWPADLDAQLEIKIHIDSKGFYQRPHRDLKDIRSPRGYGTLQIYFGSDELEDTGAWVLDADHNKVRQIPFQRNTAWCFKATDISWHSVDRIEREVDRRSIMINVYSRTRMEGGHFPVNPTDAVTSEVKRNPVKFKSFRDHTRIDFCITTYCQSKCPTCPRTDAETLELANFITLQHMPFPVWMDVIDKVDWSTKTIQFCGEHGDPMMHPDIEKFILAGTARAWQVMINTNGGIRKKEWYREIYDKVEDQDYGELCFTFAIDGLTQETNEKYRIDVDFDRAWENFLTCAENHSRLTYWDFLVFEHNWHELEDVIRIGKELEVNMDIKVNRGEHGLLVSDEGKQHVRNILGIDVDAEEQQIVDIQDAKTVALSNLMEQSKL